ncbi:MAG: hypothetical protein Q4F11_07715, partial [Eubacteriales bacterium]|nr:hypothetical protein [Eubacteriales bacterium]
ALLERSEVKPRWKSEYTMYKLIQEHFNDAIYQYRDKWLNMQSLDVFIPSKNIGVEYQGLQHYEPNDFFGGKSNFLLQVERDKLKKQLCVQNNVLLIEWRYDEPINLVTFMEKFKNYL